MPKDNRFNPSDEEVDLVKKFHTAINRFGGKGIHQQQWYNIWHRSMLSSECFAYDVDFVESRRHKGIVGFFEIKLIPIDEEYPKPDRLSNGQRIFLQNLARLVDPVPVFIVTISNISFKQIIQEPLFKVEQVLPTGVIEERHNFTEQEYITWMETL